MPFTIANSQFALQTKHPLILALRRELREYFALQKQTNNFSRLMSPANGRAAA